MKHIYQILLSIGCILLTQCLESSFQRTNNNLSILQAISSEVVLTRYEAFASSSESLSLAVTRLCNDTSNTSLLLAREAWWITRGHWKHSMIVQFGPVKEYPLRLGPKLDTWPVNQRAIEDLIDDQQVLTLDQFSALGAATRGLPVIEYLLWNETSEAEVTDQLDHDTRRCDILRFAAEDVAINAQLLVTAWREDWLELVNSSGPEEAPYDDPSEVISEWINRMAFTVEIIRVQTFEKPLGDFQPGNGRPDIVESRLSQRTLEDTRDALQGVVEIWHGKKDDTSIGKLKNVVSSTEVINLVSQQLMESTAALATLEGDLLTLVDRQPEELQTTLDSLKQLQRVIQINLTQATQTTIRFNDTDGD